MPKRTKRRRRTGDFIQRERDAAYEHVNGLRDTAALLWRKACEAEGLPVDTVFATFSADNRFAELYNNAMRELLEKIAVTMQLGYTGLCINQKGRAELL